MTIFKLLTPVSYWLLIIMWTFILIFYLRRILQKTLQGKLFNTLILVLSIDAFRTLFESIYFGAWYTSLSGFLPKDIHTFLVQPQYVFIPKFINVIAAFLVIAIILRRWIPEEEEEIRTQKEYIVRLENEVEERKKIENELNQLNSELEERIGIRTADIEKSNNELQKEMELRKKAGIMLQGIFDGITDPIFLVEHNLIVKNLNTSAMSYYDVKRDDVIGKPCYTAFRGNDAICDGCEIPAAIMEGKEAIVERRPANMPDRQERISIYPIRDDQGQVEATLMRIHDITERRMLKKQLVHTEKLAAIGILVSGIAHEINNPNNFVIFNMPILKDYLNEIMPVMDTYADDNPGLEMFYMPYKEFREDIFRLIDNVEHGARRIKTIVGDLKDFSRIKSKKSDEKVDLKPVFEKVIAFTRSKIQRTIKKFNVQIPNDLPDVLIDHQSLEQILINLLINASQAFDVTRPPGDDSQVDLLVSFEETQGKKLIIDVKDNGCGMDEETMSKIFDPFFTRKPAIEGTGLGLYISHNLIENMGGQMEVESKLGAGSRFRVVFNIP